MNELPNPFISAGPTADEAAASLRFRRPGDDDVAANRFVLDESAFMEALDTIPAFLRDPSPEYLSAVDMIPMLAVLAGH
jgi:hypothetical protein